MSTTAAIPRLTLGLPVYNGERYLAASLDALLAQTFIDFELIISDNRSTDQTAEIASHNAAQTDCLLDRVASEALVLATARRGHEMDDEMDAWYGRYLRNLGR